MLNILLFGATGQIGHELQRILTPQYNLICCDRSQVDLNDVQALSFYIKNQSPDIIINSAAYTKVDRAESETDQAYRINAKAPEIMAKVAADLGSWLVHYSTDYVFDGSKKEAYIETDPVNPINVYGKTKAEGEAAIRASNCKHLILRTSWVYSDRRDNFLQKILSMAESHETLNIVNDQIGAPTSAKLIAQSTALLIPQLASELSGTYHLTAQGSTSWASFAEYILAINKISVKINGILTEEYSTPAKRPHNSRLNSQAFCERFHVQLPEWQRDVEQYE